MTRMEYVFGIDGGGSGCRVLICDCEGKPLAQGRGGPANYFSDPEGCIRNVLKAIEDAKAQIADGTFNLKSCVAHVGLAGVIREANAESVAAAMPFDRITVTDDRVTSVVGALGDADGMLISVGTGSFVAAQSGGLHRFLGGWGHLLGDQASGAWLGIEALRRTLLAYDGLLAETDLTRLIMTRHGGTPTTLIRSLQNEGPADYAALAPSVIKAAKAGDLHGKQLMQEGAEYLMFCLTSVRFSDRDILCLTGGIGPHYADYLSPDIRSRIQKPAGTALDGAIRLARKLIEATGEP